MAITINGKVYRNLEDQVQYLTEQFQTGKLIEELGIHVLGIYTTIEDIPSEDYQYGDAYLIGTQVPYNLYVYTDLQEKGDEFIDVGVFPAIGEKGDKGDKGDTGEKGERGPKGDTGPRGYTGAKGDTGATGSQGPQGLTGAKGDKGDIGPAFNIVATLETTSQLPTPTIEMQDEGKCYLIPVDGVNHVYCIQGDTATNVKWIDLGTSGIQGPKGNDGKDGVGLNSYMGFNEGTYNSTSGSVTSTGIQYQQQSNVMYLDETVQTVQVNNQHKLPIVADSPTSITYNSDDKVFHITTDLSAKADKTELETLETNIQDNLNNNYFTKTEVNNNFVNKEKRYIVRSESNTINIDCSNFINYSMSFLTTCVWSADTASISYNGNVLFEFPLATVINMAVYKDSANMTVYYNGNKYEITIVDNNYILVLTRNRGGTVSVNVVTP
jgi:hypothetical protein